MKLPYVVSFPSTDSTAEPRPLNRSRTGGLTYKEPVAVSSLHHDAVGTKAAKFIKNMSELGQPGANNAFSPYVEEGEGYPEKFHRRDPGAQPEVEEDFRSF